MFIDIDEDFFRNVIKDSRSIAQAAEQLGLKKNLGRGGRMQFSGTVYRKINSLIRYYNLDTSHMSGMGWSNGLNKDNNDSIKKMATRLEIPWDEVFRQDCKYLIPGQRLIARLVRAGKRTRKCEECNITEWNGKPIVFQLHHDNGIVTDNREENLFILCPNCHSQTETWTGRNIRVKSKVPRSKNPYISHPTDSKTPVVYYCKTCQKPTNRKRKRGLCFDCTGITRRKVERPECDELESMLKEKSYCAVGRQFNVSDNAIRKWENRCRRNQISVENSAEHLV